MSMTPAQQQAIIAKESAWVENQFAPLDLSAFPALQPPPPPEFHDDRWARDYRDTGLSRSATDLRAFVEDPPLDVLERVGAETGNENYRAEARDQKGELVAQQFKRACPEYLPTNHNFAAIATTLAYNTLSTTEQQGDLDDIVATLIERGFWTVPNLVAMYNALTAEGILDIPAGTARNLSERERLRVARLAQAGRTSEAIGEYLRCSLDGEEPTMEMVNDPAYRDVCDSAVWTVFENITDDYVATPKREAFIRRHCGQRPITLALLQSAWAACQSNEQRRERGELLNSWQQPEAQAAPSPKDLDALSDAAVDDLYHRSLREYVRSIKSPGVLA